MESRKRKNASSSSSSSATITITSMRLPRVEPLSGGGADTSAVEMQQRRSGRTSPCIASDQSGDHGSISNDNINLATASTSLAVTAAAAAAATAGEKPVNPTGAGGGGGGGGGVGPVDPMTLPVESRRTVLLLMCVLKIATSYDAGAFSLAIGAGRGIGSDLDLDSAQAGFLGSSVYLGNVVGCACCAWLFHQRSAKYLLCVGMLLHALFTVLFALSSNFAFAIFARIGIGFTLSFVVVYSVVWADLFSPQKHATLWLAMLNIGVPVGTLCGFLAGGVIVNSAAYSWRWIFFLKAILMVPMVVFMAHVDPVMIDDPNAGTVAEKIAPTPTVDMWNNFLGNRLMILNVAGLSVLYFVVTGMQVFFTQYLREAPFYASVSDIMLSFGFTAVSAPIVGVALGGIAMDRYGNYREHPDRAADLGAIAATLAAVFGVFTTISTSIATLSFNLWMMLFFGAAALPSAMGLIVASVPPEQKSAASSFANIMFNVWGYFAGPMFCGFVAQYAGSLRVAMGATLNMGWIGVVFFWWSSKVAARQQAMRSAAAVGGVLDTSAVHAAAADGDEDAAAAADTDAIAQRVAASVEVVSSRDESSS